MRIDSLLLDLDRQFILWEVPRKLFLVILVLKSERRPSEIELPLIVVLLVKLDIHRRLLFLGVVAILGFGALLTALFEYSFRCWTGSQELRRNSFFVALVCSYVDICVRSGGGSLSSVDGCHDRHLGSLFPLGSFPCRRSWALRLFVLFFAPGERQGRTVRIIGKAIAFCHYGVDDARGQLHRCLFLFFWRFLAPITGEVRILFGLVGRRVLGHHVLRVRAEVRGVTCPKGVLLHILGVYEFVVHLYVAIFICRSRRWSSHKLRVLN